MDYGLLIESLRWKNVITDLEKDILDTWNLLQKEPFDRDSAQRQVIQNNVKRPEIFAAIVALPTTSLCPFDRVTDSDIRYNLEKQLAVLIAKEGWKIYGKEGSEL